PSITQQEAVEMLSQHIITKPVFEALFEGYSFVKNNPISVSMQTMLDLLEDQAFDKDAETLQKFYESVKMRASGIDNAEGKQRIIIELYDKFFKTAFPKMVEKLGIVYTPVEVVDFIVHSVNDVLKKEFDRSISDENIHILDPFTGTGTFITRLLQSGLIDKKDLKRKYQHEIHANEIVLLAYYIAAVNIENAFHDALEQKDYMPFDGICLTDTFQLGETDESDKLFKDMFPQNSARVAKQKKAPLRVIMGNPPYSIGQKSANDNAQNQSYPKLEAKISSTYTNDSEASLNKSSHDAYIKAFRWSTDRLDPVNGGIISFITNGSWIYKPSMDGFRSTIEKEFSSIYVFDLRGGVKGRSGEKAKKEGQNVFDIMTGVAITVLVKNPQLSRTKAKIFFHDIGDYLNRAEKIKKIIGFGSINSKEIEWQEIQPNEQNDWLEQRSNVFETFIPITPTKKFDTKTNSFFCTNAIGVATNRDAWVYNYSKRNLETNMRHMIAFYNEQATAFESVKKNNSKITVDKFIDSDPKKISWTVNLKKDIDRGMQHKFLKEETRIATYRPFCNQALYFSKPFIERPGISLKLFPNRAAENLSICITGTGDRRGFAALMTNNITDLQTLENSQQFPLYHFEERNIQSKDLFDDKGDYEYVRRDGVSDFILDRAKTQYGKNVSKEDIFFYVYGFLHSPEYREMFANDLKKMLPRLPLVEDVKDFWTFSKAGRKLAELHINYETVSAYKDAKVSGEDSGFYIVEKMRFPKKDQKDTIHYNSKITISNIPAKAYEYVVNGKSAIEWIVERYQVKTHEESGIKNDPNDWSTEVGNPRYILDLLLSIINVSVQTVEIVEGLPKVKFE
ncbi:MAG TPA: N-6 DNA methylase, partial [Saprospiraceae bacterium]|nr:N-6 DNA methylase [Saprospiraceae bacterium]